ncbi:FtsB family cell division protein [Reichenbachiella versicolor]|uniref:FtsB family cell division protein n=1 Tax=Reichenbachiella versicolor TaxID=1821036 RepID=UPI000D6DF028|nr:septum formation initiator family protein [Reichenbachiella versicolor]
MFKPKIKIPTNFYLIVGVGFLFWMLFFDSNDFYSQYQLRSKLIELEQEKKYYQDKVKEVEQDREALLKDKDKLEKFAREKYYMKKDNEDVFVILEE